MFRLLFDTLSAKIDLSEKDREICREVFIPRKLRKRQFLLQEGDVNRYTAFINHGCLRSYSVNDKGSEKVMQFAIEGWWIADMYSFLTGEPSSVYIEALENSDVLLIDRISQDRLFSESPKFERFFRLLLENNYIATNKRLMSSINSTAEEKFLDFASSYPRIIERVPQHMVASYLGITPETLSRIRQHLANKR